MTKQLDPEQFEDIKEMMIYEVVLSEALVNLLDKKGLIKKAELLEEIKRIKSKTIEKKKWRPAQFALSTHADEETNDRLGNGIHGRGDPHLLPSRAADHPP